MHLEYIRLLCFERVHFAVLDLYWRDASLTTLDCCIGEMYLLINYYIEYTIVPY